MERLRYTLTDDGHFTLDSIIQTWILRFAVHLRLFKIMDEFAVSYSALYIFVCF